MKIFATIATFGYRFHYTKTGHERVQAEVSLRGYVVGELDQLFGEDSDRWYRPEETYLRSASLSFDSLGRNHPTPTEVMYSGVPNERIGKVSLSKNFATQGEADSKTISLSMSVTLPLSQYQNILSMNGEPLEIGFDFCKQNDGTGTLARKTEAIGDKVHSTVYVKSIEIKKNTNESSIDHAGRPEKITGLINKLKAEDGPSLSDH
jgi:hypothetical protein